MMAAFMLLVLINRNAYRWVIIGVLTIVSVFLIVQNNNRWSKASDLTKEVQKIINQDDKKQVVLINLPEELEGAFVFRNGFLQSLVINGVDTSRVMVSHYLNRLEYLAMPDNNPVIKEKDRLFVYPATYIVDSQHDTLEIRGPQNKYLASLRKQTSTIYYWNNIELVKLY
ncbi:hypothetical protein [Paraflavitalea speifideaquila]|uniref:hypothetical protein n=1 Tax=Paraflavitalea speifideaquila TaxID=3076558 RepID=UPI0028F1012D|nr:hypothetical protein [Paraflavitalea speifideiaquila]